MTTLSQVKHAVAEVLGHDPRTIDPDERLTDLGADEDDMSQIELDLWKVIHFPQNDPDSPLLDLCSTCRSIANWLDALP